MSFESIGSLELMKLDRKTVISVFRDLVAPQISEMNGEYRATLLDQGHWAHNFFTAAAFHFPGTWLSKSFTPISDQAGQGYNTFRTGKTISKIYRMNTYLAGSFLDGKHAYHLDYLSIERQDRLPLLVKLAGQIRRLSEGRYLGLGIADFGISRIRRAQPFLLEGPIADYDQSVWTSALGEPRAAAA